MKIHLTQPNLDHPLLADIHELWLRAAKGEHPVDVYRAKPGEMHQDLLTRIWRDILPQKKTIHLIADMDFVPHPLVVENVESVLDNGRRAIFCPQIVWDSKRETFTNRWPLTAFWFTVLDLTEVELMPPENWLWGFPPRLNEPSMVAYIQALLCGMFDPVHVECAAGESTFPMIRSAWYEGLGLHLFFARRFNDPPYEFIWDDSDYTLGEHLARSREIVDACLRGSDLESLIWTPKTSPVQSSPP